VHTRFVVNVKLGAGFVIKCYRQVLSVGVQVEFVLTVSQVFHWAQSHWSLC